MGFRTLSEVRAYQAAREFKREIYRLLASSARAQNDFEFRSQLRRAARSCVSNIAEGFGRHLAGEFIYFLRISRGSLHEALEWIDDGVDSGYFDAASCRRARELGDKAGRLTTSLIKSLKPFVRPSRPTTKAKKADPAKPPQGPLPARTKDS